MLCQSCQVQSSLSRVPLVYAIHRVQDALRRKSNVSALMNFLEMITTESGDHPGLYCEHYSRLASHSKKSA